MIICTDDESNPQMMVRQQQQLVVTLRRQGEEEEEISFNSSAITRDERDTASNVLKNYVYRTVCLF